MPCYPSILVCRGFIWTHADLSQQDGPECQCKLAVYLQPASLTFKSQIQAPITFWTETVSLKYLFKFQRPGRLFFKAGKLLIPQWIPQTIKKKHSEFLVEKFVNMTM